MANKLRIVPNVLGKLTIALQFILIGFALITMNLKNGIDVPELFIFLVALLTTISGLQYVYKGMKIASSESV